MKPVNASTKLPAASSARSGRRSLVIEELKRRHLPVNLQNYLAFAFLDPSKELEAEEVAALPPEIREEYEAKSTPLHFVHKRTIPQLDPPAEPLGLPLKTSPPTRQRHTTPEGENDRIETSIDLQYRQVGKAGNGP